MHFPILSVIIASKTKSSDESGSTNDHSVLLPTHKLFILYDITVDTDQRLTVSSRKFRISYLPVYRCVGDAETTFLLSANRWFHSFTNDSYRATCPRVFWGLNVQNKHKLVYCKANVSPPRDLSTYLTSTCIYAKLLIATSYFGLLDVY